MKFLENWLLRMLALTASSWTRRESDAQSVGMEDVFLVSTLISLQKVFGSEV